MALNEIETKLQELENKVKQVTAHSNALEKSTREAFEKVLNQISEITNTSIKYGETINKTLNNLPHQELEDKMRELEEKFEFLKQDIIDSIENRND